MTIREMINRLEKLSDGGNNDNDEVLVKIGGVTYEVKSILMGGEPDYDFDTANCGPSMWAEMEVYE